ncbi:MULTISPECIES: potassium channel family protein [unclassified Kocuria]|uniref:potassium channel family protein n=1 Tax=unclassified Kocuria TaxID=2649579 RepID=UPI00069BF239|nr:MULTISPECIES: potassium channel family protein [unclassified Kocuria]
MGVLLTVLGITIVLVGLWDMYHSLLHPSGTGAIGGRVQTVVWRISRLTGHRFGSAVGPGSMITVVLLWVLMQGVGWALVYLPHVPQGFTYSPGVNPVDYPDALDALYISLVTLATLGFGDVVATDPWVRLATPLEALTGFALLTAALTWFTQIYPPLSRRRSLALELKALSDVGYADGIAREDPVTVARVLDGLAAEVAKARIDFTQHGETYYFQEEDPDLSLARQLSYALELRDRAAASPSPEVCTSARRLGLALEQLGQKLREEFVSTGTTPEEVFAAYATDHRREPGR